MNSLREQRAKNLSFIKEIDEENCYQFAFNSLDFNHSNQYQSLVQTMFELLFKNPFLPLDYTVYIRSKDKHEDPSFRQLMTWNETEIKHVRETILGLDQEDCDFLVSGIEDRNTQTHKRYLEIDEETKIEYTKILFKALKNAYEYKTHKTLSTTFELFLSSLRISVGDIRVSEENDTLRLENEALKKQLQLKVPQKTVTRVTEKPAYVEPSPLESRPIEEVRYGNVVKNDKYIIPEEIGKEIKYESSPHIDIAFDFLNRGWFSEAEDEAHKANNPLSVLVSYLAQKQYKHIGDLIVSASYIADFNDILRMLKNVPNEAASSVLKMLVETFYNTKLDFERKSFVFEKLVAIRLAPVQQNKIRDNYFAYLMNSTSDFASLRSGYEIYYSSFSEKNYKKAIIDSLTLLHSKKKYSLILDIKQQLFADVESPELSELALLCQTESQSFDELLKNVGSISDARYLEKVLNYYYFHKTDKFNQLLSVCIETVTNLCSKPNFREANLSNGIILLTAIAVYSFEAKERLIDKWVDLFKSPSVWPKHKDDALALLVLLEERKPAFVSLITKWFLDALDSEHDFYCQLTKKARLAGIENDMTARIQILSSCCFTNNFQISEGEPTTVSEEDIRLYLSHTSDYPFVTSVISAINKFICVENSPAYISSFKVLLPYCKENDKTKFKLLQVLAEKLVSFGEFSYADELYRYMLGLEINLSICYWGLLFCSTKSKDLKELATAEGLFENVLFQETLHLSKEEDPGIYQQCLDLYDSYKANEKIKTIEHKTKVLNDVSLIAFLLLLFNSFALLILLIASGANGRTWWPYLVGEILNFILLITVGVIRGGSNNVKKAFAGSVIGLVVASVSLATLGAVHTIKAANADGNYAELKTMMRNFDGSWCFREISSKIDQIPLTYKDTNAIREEMKDLEWAFNKFSYGRSQWGKVYNFDSDHYNWDCTKYLYNYSFHSLFIDGVWDIEGTNKQLYYYQEGTSEWFAPSTALPNNMDSSKEYYFYTEYAYFNDSKAMVNQYMRFGYENKNDGTDKFLAYQIGDYRINSQGKRQITVFCYSNSKEYKLIFNKDYKSSN